MFGRKYRPRGYARKKRGEKVVLLGESYRYNPDRLPGRGKAQDVAEMVRFELTSPLGPPVFKTGAFNRSATSPRLRPLIVLKGSCFFK